jgi:DNA uptake protein ComE-like DNA-binding protein
MGLIDRLPDPWSASQRRVILFIVAGLVIYGSIQLFRNRSYVPDPQPAMPPQAADLADKLDPNTADVATLAVLPLIGDKRAADIIAYRDRYARNHPGEPAFKKVEDLLNIRGIGLAMVAQIRPYLVFPTTQPTTRPAGL